MAEIIGSKKFTAIASGSAESESIFIDTSDNKLKFKDTTGSVKDLY